MNAARRAIVKEIQAIIGCTLKEAYEASKDPFWMRDWIRVSIKEPREKKQKPISYRSHRNYLKKIRALAELKRNKRD